MISKHCKLAFATACIVLAVCLTAHAVKASQAGKSPVKVFLLAGQSNMEGKGSIKHLEQLTSEPEKAKIFGRLKTRDGKWVERDDVWMWFLGKKGDLTVGYAKPGNRFGPELGLGHVVGDAFDNQALLIKTARGGRRLAKSFRPPSSGGEVGPDCTNMINHMRSVLGNLKRQFPDYDGQGYEIAGFVWFQGWNDHLNREYKDNMANLIRDFRRECNAPNMKVVIGEFGCHGAPQDDWRAKVRKHVLATREAQAGVAKMPEFRGSVMFVKTTPYLRTEPKFDGGYHYQGSAETFYLIGDALGKAMVELLKNDSSHTVIPQSRAGMAAFRCARLPKVTPPSRRQSRGRPALGGGRMPPRQPARCRRYGPSQRTVRFQLQPPISEALRHTFFSPYGISPDSLRFHRDSAVNGCSIIGRLLTRRNAAWG